jgi:hypothetical membrane protein
MTLDPRRLGLLCGVVSPILWMTLIGLAGAARPDFNLMTGYISELGARGSSTEFVVNYGAFLLTGALYVCFAAAAGTVFAGRWGYALAAGLIALDGLGRMGAGVYPCDPGCRGNSASQELHRLFATAGFSAGIASALGWGVVTWRDERLRGLAWYSIATGVVAGILLLVMSSEPRPLAIVGLLEHIASGCLSLWLLVLASRLLRGDRT